MTLGQILGGGGGFPPIKTIRYGTVTVNAASASGTDTFAAVDMSNTMTFLLGISHTTGSAADAFGLLELISTTQVRVTRNSTTGTMTAGYLLIEFYPGVIRSVTRSVIILTGVATNTAALTNVDINKTFVTQLGALNNDTTSADAARWMVRLTLTSVFVLTATKGTATGNAQVSYEVVEFY